MGGCQEGVLSQSGPQVTAVPLCSVCFWGSPCSNADESCPGQELLAVCPQGHGSGDTDVCIEVVVLKSVVVLPAASLQASLLGARLSSQLAPQSCTPSAAPCHLWCSSPSLRQRPLAGPCFWESCPKRQLFQGQLCYTAAPSRYWMAAPSSQSSMSPLLHPSGSSWPALSMHIRSSHAPLTVWSVLPSWP